MRLLHTADWHLGQELHGVDRTAEQSRILDQIISIALSRAVDAVLVSGDVYHAVNPPIRAQKLLYRALSTLAERAPGLQIALIAGNHDSPARLELPLSLPLALDGPCPDAAGLHVVGALPRANGRADPAACARLLRRRDGAPGAAIALVPFLRPGDLALGADQAALFAVAAEAARAVAAAAGAPNLPLLLAAHLHARGGEISEDSERPILIGGEDAVPATAFPDILDYVALGHLHRAQTLQTTGPMIRYAGSPLPLSATERSYRHSVTLLDLSQRPLRAEAIDLARPRPFLRAPERGFAEPEALVAALASLAAAAADAEPPDPDLTPFLEVGVRLDAPEPDLRARLEAALGDAPLRLTRILRGAGPDAPADAPAAPDLATLSPEHVFERLHERVHGAAPPDDLRRAFRALLMTDGAPEPADAP